MRYRVALTVGLVTVLLLGVVTAGQTQPISVDDPKAFAGRWFGRAIVHNTTLPTELSIKEDGTYSGHVGSRPVAGVIRMVGQEARYEGAATRGRMGLYQGADKRFLRAWADSGEILEYEERK
jgi:hypothetical protein